jgi:methionine biosynthesis protein MetW
MAHSDSSADALRRDLEVIYEMIPAGCRVLDLGCGRGELLSRLIADKQIFGQGLELSLPSVCACIEKGVPVIQANLDQARLDFPDNRFDYVILNQTLQWLHRPEEMLREIVRVGHWGIVSLSNSAHWRLRLHLLAAGRLPLAADNRLSAESHPAHSLTLKDWQDWTIRLQIKTAEALFFSPHWKTLSPRAPLAFLRARYALFCISR